jgi:hypothetical protein
MFIKLTGYPNDLSVYVQADQIVFFGNHPDGHTHLQLQNMESGVGVKETPEQIMEMIKNA